MSTMNVLSIPRTRRHTTLSTHGHLPCPFLCLLSHKSEVPSCCDVGRPNGAGQFSAKDDQYQYHLGRWERIAKHEQKLEQSSNIKKVQGRLEEGAGRTQR